jgi:hypothetical protein
VAECSLIRVVARREENRMRWRWSANQVGRHICLLIIFVFLLIPSVRPLWKGRVGGLDVQARPAGGGAGMR